MTVWTHDLLDALRQIGDPRLDRGRGKKGWRSVRYQQVDRKRLLELLPEAADLDEEKQLLLTWRGRQNGALPEDGASGDPFWTDVTEPMDPVRLEVVHSLFAVYGGEISASLLLASLPNAYAAEAGAAVLSTTGELKSNARRRIGETAQLIVDVLFPTSERLYDVEGLVVTPSTPSLLPGGRGYVRARTTRLTHAVVRELIMRPDKDGNARWDPTSSAELPRHQNVLRGVPINQEDLLGTLGTFTVTTFEAMEKLGIPWNDEAEAAYLHHWDRVGELLGIGTPEVVEKLGKAFDLPDDYKTALRPKSVGEARQLQQLIRERSWPLEVDGVELSPFTNANGKVLVRALLDELQEAMPRGMERLPIFVMRYLVHDSAHELLGLGGGGVPDSLLRWPSEQRFTRGASRRYGKGLVESAMRMAAADISRRSFVHFIRERRADQLAAPFWFPAVKDHWVDGGHGRG